MTCRPRKPHGSAESTPNTCLLPRSALALLQVGPDDLRTNALAELVAAIGSRDAFHQLRTVEQLG